MARERETQPDILDPSRTRPAKPASPATVPMPGERPEERKRWEEEEKKREKR